MGIALAQAPQDRPIPFTQADKERLIRIEVTLEQFMKATEKRFEALETTTSVRFAAMEKRLEQLERRMEKVENHLQALYTLLITLIGIFITAFVGLFGYLLWDRRTSIRPFQARLETQEARLSRLLEALRILAKSDEKLAALLKEYNLL